MAGLAVIPLAIACSSGVKPDHDHMTRAEAQAVADKVNTRVHGTCGRRYIKQRPDGGWAVIPSMEGCPDQGRVQTLRIHDRKLEH
jgi:hypothetical protein